MASDSSTLDNLESWNVNYYTNLVPFSILLYDYCLTFVAEVERCWGVRQLNWALVFFYLNRYLVLFGHAPIMLAYFWTTSNPNKTEMLVSIPSLELRNGDQILLYILSSCQHLQIFHQYLAIMLQVVVGAILIMHMYALYGRSRKVLSLYISVAAVILVVAYWALLSGTNEKPWDHELYIGCGAPLSREKAIRFGIFCAGMLILDLLVFGMTLYKSIVVPCPNRGNIMDILLRDGAIYFGVMLACHLANILTFMLGGPFTRTAGVTFSNVISSVMISRFMLNLRDPSLLLNGRRASFNTPTAELTYPITTNISEAGSFPTCPVPYDVPLTDQREGIDDLDDK